MTLQQLEAFGRSPMQPALPEPRASTATRLSRAPIEARGLVKVFGGLRAVDDMSIELRRGEMLGVIGPTGAGKTTLFNLLAGSPRPTAGTVHIGGKDLTRAGDARHKTQN